MVRVRYLDHNATSPGCPAARSAWLDTVERVPGNPGSPHRWGARADRALDAAREGVAAALGCPAGDVVWTSGATESNNAVLHHAALAGGGEAWISALEHPCVLAAARRWFPGRHQLIPAGPHGQIDLDWIVDRLRTSRPALVAVMAANNETGVLQPWSEVVALTADAGVPVLCDAAQWLGKEPAASLGRCAYVTGCAHKFGGMPGVGFLKCPGALRPLLVGGGQEEGRRAGTENVPGAVACAAALQDREAAIARVSPETRARVRDQFEAFLSARLGEFAVVGQGAPRLWNTSAVLLPVPDCRRRWVVRLDKLGFAVSTGSACASGREKPSHVLAAMGIDGRGERMIRVSGGWETPPEDWQALAEAIVQLAEEEPAGPPATVT